MIENAHKTKPAKTATPRKTPARTAAATQEKETKSAPVEPAPIAANADATVTTPAASVARPASRAKTTPQASAVDEAKIDKMEKNRKPKLVRDSFTMPENEYAQIASLKRRLLGQQVAAKKSELLRAGLALLSAQKDAELARLIGQLTPIKTGRPAKK